MLSFKPTLEELTLILLFQTQEELRNNIQFFNISLKQSLSQINWEPKQLIFLFILLKLSVANEFEELQTIAEEVIDILLAHQNIFQFSDSKNSFSDEVKQQFTEDSFNDNVRTIESHMGRKGALYNDFFIKKRKFGVVNFDSFVGEKEVQMMKVKSFGFLGEKMKEGGEVETNPRKNSFLIFSKYLLIFYKFSQEQVIQFLETILSHSSQAIQNYKKEVLEQIKQKAGNPLDFHQMFELREEAQKTQIETVEKQESQMIGIYQQILALIGQQKLHKKDSLQIRLTLSLLDYLDLTIKGGFKTLIHQQQ